MESKLVNNKEKTMKTFKITINHPVFKGIWVLHGVHEDQLRDNKTTFYYNKKHSSCKILAIEEIVCKCIP
jgi:hypothetical protein